MTKKSNARQRQRLVSKIITDEQTGIKHRISSDIRVASQGYANISGILAGFAFTVIILIIQINGTDTIRVVNIQNKAAVGFLVSFFACIMSCFAFSVITAEEILTPRTNHMALFAGLGFSTATSLVFWSLAIILKTFLVNDVATVAHQIFPLFIFIHPAYVATSILDSIYLFDFRRPTFKEFLVILVPSYLPLFTAIVIRFQGVSIDIYTNNFYFSCLIWSTLAASITNNLLAIIFSISSEEYRLKLWISGVFIGFQSLLLGIMILSMQI